MCLHIVGLRPVGSANIYFTLQHKLLPASTFDSAIRRTWGDVIWPKTEFLTLCWLQGQREIAINNQVFFVCLIQYCLLLGVTLGIIVCLKHLLFIKAFIKKPNKTRKLTYQCITTCQYVRHCSAESYFVIIMLAC